MRPLLCLCLVLLTFCPTIAEAASEEVGYSRSQVYSTALRYLRIDRRYEVTERDEKAAYLLFEYQALGQTKRRFGAVEIVPLSAGVRLVVRLPEQPTYEEVVFRDALLRKLREDYGDPKAKAREKEREPTAGDAADSGREPAGKEKEPP